MQATANIKIIPSKVLISAFCANILLFTSACANTLPNNEPQSTADSRIAPPNDTRHVSGRLIAYTTPVGSSEVNAALIKPYHARWTSPGGAFEETLEVIDTAQWRHTQVGFQRKDDQLIKMATETRALSRHDLRSLSWTREHHISSPRLPFKDVSVVVHPDGVIGEMTAKDGTKAPFNAPLPMPVFDGWIAGLAIAALPLEKDYWASLPTGTYIFKGAHHLTIRVLGQTETETPQGEKIPTWEVEAEWVDLNSGDIYEPGATGAGGVYHIAVEPGAGVPPVIKYEAQSNPIIWDGVRLPAPE